MTSFLSFRYNGNAIEVPLPMPWSQPMAAMHFIMEKLAIDHSQFTIISFNRDEYAYEPHIPIFLVLMLPASHSPYQCNVLPLGSPQALNMSIPSAISVMQDVSIDGRRLMESLSSHGYARLRLTDKSMIQVMRVAKSATPPIFECTREEKLGRKRVAMTGGGLWGEGDSESKRRPFVGYSLDFNGREFFPVRRYDGLFPWPRSQPDVFAQLFDAMDSISRAVLKLICVELGMDDRKVMELLDPAEDLPWVHGEWTEPSFRFKAIRNARMIARAMGWHWLERLLPPPPRFRRSGASVLRVYKYFKDKNQPPSPPATGFHCDMGLVTVALRSDVPGLMIFNSSQGFLMDVERPQAGQGEEGEGEGEEIIIFAGEALGLITGGRVKAPCHFVEESFVCQPRFSFPFFLRPRPEADLSPLIDPRLLARLHEDRLKSQKEGSTSFTPLTYGAFIERIMWKDRPWSPKPGSSNSPLGSDY